MAYNVACCYAQVGHPALALDAMCEALDRLPHLKERCREDPELLSLRDDPAFQALLDHLRT